MSDSSFEKLQQTEEVRINFGINSDKRDIVNIKTDTEIVYKPTTMDIGSKWNHTFQKLEPEIQETPKDSLFLYRTAFTGNLLAFAAGIGFSWTSPVLPKLQGPENPLNVIIDASQESIIAAILCVGAAIGPFVFGYLADKIGRKKTLVGTALPMGTGLIILAFTDEVMMYYLGRLLYGIGCGGVFTALMMYTGEITADHNRGKFSCILGIFVASGVLYPFSIGTMLSIKMFCLSSLIPLIIFLLVFIPFAPDSPHYLVSRGRNAEAQRAIQNLRSVSEDHAQAELHKLQKIVEREKSDKGGVAVLFRNRGTRRAFMVAAGLLFLQQVSGINAVTGFMEMIFKAAGSTIPSQVATTLIGVIQVLTVFITSSVIEKLGRKFLLLMSTLGCSVSITLLGLYFFLHRHNFTMLAYFWWLPIACLIIYIICFNFGLGPVAWTVLSEVFPNNVKSSASAIASSTCFIVSFFVTMAFPIINELLGMAECFWLFGVCCLIGCIFIQCVVPETKGKNIVEIQEILSK